MDTPGAVYPQYCLHTYVDNQFKSLNICYCIQQKIECCYSTLLLDKVALNHQWSLFTCAMKANVEDALKKPIFCEPTNQTMKNHVYVHGSLEPLLRVVENG